MWKILIKRSFRDLKTNKLRYLALAVLIAFSIYMVVGIMGAAITVIVQSDAKDNAFRVEDGQFTVFVPLSNAETDRLKERGIELEETFYMDFQAGGEGEDILRLYAVREKIDLISLIDGGMPAKEDEIVIERRYSEENGIHTGDAIIVGGKHFTVSGIGATPDYDCVLRKLSDSSAESGSFGTGFVTKDAYEKMRAAHTAMASEYLYLYKYPEEHVPDGGYEALVKTCSKEFMSYTFDIELAGIREDDPFFGIKTMPSSPGEAAVSASFACKYKLNKGDIFTLQDKENDRIYAFRVVDSTDYTASLMVYMNIDDMRGLMGYGNDYYNAVFSDHDLKIANGRLYSVLSKGDIRKSAVVFVDHMRGLIYMLAVASAVIFLMVMYLMMKTMVDRSSFSISLVKVFGYRDKEVRKMYLDGNFYIIAAGALISLPVTKMIMNLVYPAYLVGNVGVGISQAFPWYVYAGMYVVILVLYVIINNILILRIRRVMPAEVLKNRE